MRRVRLGRLSGQLFGAAPARPVAAAPRLACSRATRISTSPELSGTARDQTQRRCESTRTPNAATKEAPLKEDATRHEAVSEDAPPQVTAAEQEPAPKETPPEKDAAEPGPAPKETPPEKDAAEHDPALEETQPEEEYIEEETADEPIPDEDEEEPINYAELPLPSPPPSRARYSAKLAALHARLALPSKLPLETLARALVDPSADGFPKYNNANLAYVGTSILQYHTSEYLITKWPRLPMAVLFESMKAYVGPRVLHMVSKAWGIEAAAAPGEEVDPGYLQFDPLSPSVSMTKWGFVRAESAEINRFKWRRGMSSRITYDDAFGEMMPGQMSTVSKLQTDKIKDRNSGDAVLPEPEKNAAANFVRALVGAIYLHCGADTAKYFVRTHFLSRSLDLSGMFEFKTPTRELARLCAREDFDSPVARLESETGRLSRTPVFVVGIYSGRDKLGEGFGPSLDVARIAAAINALKSWYLYSPGEVMVPSDAAAEDAEPFQPAHVDIGEIIS